MRITKSLLIVLALAAAFTLLVPADSAEARPPWCQCSWCSTNLLAPCYWPGYGNVLCVDYWEFQCFAGPALAPADDFSDLLSPAEPAGSASNSCAIDSE